MADDCDFKFKFSLEYCQEVEELLYKSATYSKKLPEHWLQLKSPNRAQCLLCNESLQPPLSERAAEEHFGSSTHARNQNEDAFDFYHRVFMRLPESTQKIQVYFNPFSADRVSCDVCRLTLVEHELASHVALEQTRNDAAVRSCYWPTITPSPSQTNGVSPETLDYSKLTAIDVAVDRLRTVRRTVSPLVFRRIGTVDVCLLCEKVLTESVEQHVALEQHVRGRSYESLHFLSHFHTFWLNQPEVLQSFSKYFMVIGMKKVRCLLCMKRVPYTKVIGHVTDEFPCTFYSVDHPMRDESVDWEQHRQAFFESEMSFALGYEEDVCDIYYPKGLMDDVRALDEVPLFTVQRQLNNTYCLLCRQLLCNVKSSSDILDHIRSEEHRQSSYNKKKLRILVCYHKFWSSQKPNIQVMQHKFLPLNVLRFKCTVCLTKVVPAQVVHHIGIHMNANGVAVKYANNEVENQGTDEQDEEASATENNPEEGSYTDYDDAVEEPVSTKLAKLDLAEPTDDDVEQAVPPAKTTVNMFDYDPETIAQLYPNYNTAKGQRRPTVYFMQKRSKSSRYCLSCCKPVLGPPMQHIDSKKHQKEFADQLNIGVLTAYHAFWISQKPPNQLKQVYFNPFSRELVICDCCNNQLNFKLSLTHVCKQMIKREKLHTIVPEQLQKYRPNYCPAVWKKYFSKILMEVSRSLLCSEMPFATHYLNKMTCLICGRRMMRDFVCYQNHLTSCANSIDSEHLQIIHTFHMFWGTLPDVEQALLIHYVPLSQTELRCNDNHTVEYKDVLQHSRSCIRRSKFASLMKMVKSKALQDVADQPARNTSQDRGSVGSGASSTAAPSSSKNTPATPSPSRTKPRIITNSLMRNYMNEIKNSPDKAAIDEIKGGPLQTHEVVPSVANLKSTDVIQLIPRRLALHAKYLKQNPRALECSACHDYLRPEPFYVMTHLIMPEHLGRTSSKVPNVQAYFCDICFHRSKSEGLWQEHLFSKHHLAIVSKVAPARRALLQEYECLSCRMVIFGDTISVNRHKESFGVKRERRNAGQVALPKEVQRQFESRSTLKTVVDHLIFESNAALNNCEDMHECLRGLEVALSKTFPNCRAYPFGSRVTGIGSRKSDLDVFMDIGGMYLGEENQESKEQQLIVLKVRDILTADQKNFADVMPITSARTPIVRVVHVPTNIDCDLSFRHGLSVENTKYISFCVELQPVAREALLLLKRWADIVSLKDEITSYALCMMLIFHLQLQGYLLPVAKLQSLCNKYTPSIDGWRIIDYSLPVKALRKHVKIFQEDVYDLVKEFFSMYSTFNFEIEVVCPLLGRPVMKQQFANDGSMLPNEMAPYKQRLKTDPDCVFRSAVPMCVQDPFDLGHNLTKAVPKMFRNKFVNWCAQTFQMMSKRGQ